VSEGSSISFFKNGVDLGVGFTDIYEGCYFPAVALYEHARVEFHDQRSLKFPEVLENYAVIGV